MRTRLLVSLLQLGLQGVEYYPPMLLTIRLDELAMPLTVQVYGRAD